MSLPRTPRFKPQLLNEPYDPDELEIDILKAVYDFRVINTPQLTALFQHRLKNPAGNKSQRWSKHPERTGQGISRRLYNLFHHGYLDRPDRQKDLQKRMGNIPAIYALRDRGAEALRAAGFEVRRKSRRNRWHQQNTAIVPHRLYHQLQISQFIVTVQLAAAAHPRIEFLYWKREHDLLPKKSPSPIPSSGARKA